METKCLLRVLTVLHEERLPQVVVERRVPILLPDFGNHSAPPCFDFVPQTEFLEVDVVRGELVG